MKVGHENYTISPPTQVLKIDIAGLSFWLGLAVVGGMADEAVGRFGEQVSGTNGT